MAWHTPKGDKEKEEKKRRKRGENVKLAYAEFGNANDSGAN